MPEPLRSASLPVIVSFVATFFGLLTMGNVVLGFVMERVVPKRKIFAVPLANGQLGFELTGNLVFLGVTIVTFSAALSSGVIRFGEDSILRSVATFTALLFGFQIFYYFLHRAMHTRALLWMHPWHHRSQVTTALSAQSMSFFEALGWMLGYVGLPLAFSLIVPIGFWGYVAYMVFNVSGNIVGHANVELAAPASATRSATLFANPWVYHALHHARWTGHYGFQAALMDRLGGTEFADWPALYARVASGKPLETLKARGD
jgi:sterol desaturase/sphingolipid hydroxylase (fatty acid hydroxylase superfamily)